MQTHRSASVCPAGNEWSGEAASIEKDTELCGETSNNAGTGFTASCKKKKYMQTNQQSMHKL